MSSIEVGLPPRKYIVSLRVSGERLDPTTVSQQLSCPPDEAHARGDRVSKSGALARTGMWCITATGSSGESLSDLIYKLLLRTVDDSEIWRKLGDEFSCDVFIGVWMDSDNAMWAVEPKALDALHARRLQLSFDVYGAPT